MELRKFSNRKTGTAWSELCYATGLEMMQGQWLFATQALFSSEKISVP